VAMVVAVFPVPDVDPVLESARLEELARLGVTHAALFRDTSVAGLVLEGWAFDARDAERAVRAIAGTTVGFRILQSLVQMAVSSATECGADGKERERCI
jgi:hypothetical protein